MARELEKIDTRPICCYLSIKGKQYVDRILYHKKLMQARHLKILVCRKASQWTPRLWRVNSLQNYCRKFRDFNRHKAWYLVSQEAYARKTLENFRMQKSKSVNTSIPYGEKLSKLEEGQRVGSIYYRIIVESFQGLVFFKELDFIYL